jgi:GDP-L-fucose synthase
MDDFRGRKVLVTGPTGLIGSHFVEELLRDGASVRIVAHERRPWFGEAVEVVTGDLRLFEVCRRATAGVDDVVQAAGVSGGSGKVVTGPIPMFTDSLLINTHMLEAARLAKVGRYLFVSNSSVYASGEGPLREADAWGVAAKGAPENETGMVKRAGEVQCALYARAGGMTIAIVRGGNAYGPHDNFDLDASHVVPALIRKAVERQSPYVVWGSPDVVRDFVHARDIARGGLWLLAHHAVCEPVNVATGRTVTIRQLAEIVVKAAGYPGADIRFDAAAAPASPAKRLDVTTMQRLGFAPAISLEDGIQDTIAWYRQRVAR